ncbi:MAG: KTSC domain-containing protein [Alphaproteobacteria bacterium]
MDRLPVNSSSLASVGYDPASATLEIEFKSGKIYQYFDVPEHEHQALMQASSQGSYFAKHIRNNYRNTLM